MMARALAMRPALVLADEPTGNLDTKSSDAAFDLLRNVNESSGTTFLIVTHDPRLAQRCDRIIELVDGRLVSDQPNNGPVTPQMMMIDSAATNADGRPAAAATRVARCAKNAPINPAEARLR